MGDSFKVTGPPVENPRPPPGRKPPRPQPRGDFRGPVSDLEGLDDSLDASHRRMRYALAVQSRRVELSAQKGGLTSGEIEILRDLSTTWRTLVTNQPAPDLSELSEEEIRAQLAAVKARGQ